MDTYAEDIPEPPMSIKVGCCCNCSYRASGMDVENGKALIVEKCRETFITVKSYYVCKSFKERVND